MSRSKKYPPVAFAQGSPNFWVSRLQNEVWKKIPLILVILPGTPCIHTIRNQTQNNLHALQWKIGILLGTQYIELICGNLDPIRVAKAVPYSPCYLSACNCFFTLTGIFCSFLVVHHRRQGDRELHLPPISQANLNINATHKATSECY